jgi:hypothetical protein
MTDPSIEAKSAEIEAGMCTPSYVFTDFLKQWTSPELRPVIDVSREMVAAFEKTMGGTAPTEAERPPGLGRPTEEMMADKRFLAIWSVVKDWDIGIPSLYGGYCGGTGSHVRAIYDALSLTPQKSGAGEPVAWRWKPKGSVSWIYNPEAGWLDGQDIATVDIEPLYASPPPEDRAGWQPIETAPRDGTRILARGGALDEIEVVAYSPNVGAWATPHYTLDDRDDEPDGYNRPRFWMPLPGIEPLGATLPRADRGAGS